jgi:hypothetical protein
VFKKILVLMIMLVCSFQAYAMNSNPSSEESYNQSVPVASHQLALAPYKHQPEFMGTREWLRRQYPSFSEECVKDHPLFPSLTEAIALADFELDVLETFMFNYMQTDMDKTQGTSILPLRENVLAVKSFVGNIIDILEGRKTIADQTEDFLFSRFKCIAQYADELKGKKIVVGGSTYTVVGERITEDSVSEFFSLRNGFLRSYNTKNKIIQDLLYYLKDQGFSPLKERLSPRLLALIKLSSSLHPFFNKEDASWLDYDIALESGELRNFLGNASAIEAKKSGIREEDKAYRDLINEIKGQHRLPDRGDYILLFDMKTPSFLEEGRSGEQAASSKQKKGKSSKSKKGKSKKHRASKTVKNTTLKTEAVNDEEDNKSSEDEVDETLTLKGAALNLEDAAVAEQCSLDNSSLAATVGDATLTSFSDEQPSEGPSAKLHHVPAKALVAKKRFATEEETMREDKKVGSAHINTIYEIFRPQGYKNVDDNKIIAAWQHVLQGNGHHKIGTGRSHQPLYAELDDGSHVVLGLFRSKSYGPNYIKYVRDAFDKIGFGRAWLEAAGYRLN